ncbi:MAG: FTR1 family protein, partial [Chloroflexi bacterium]|nr:FTR1 family protein [Chloroflexota bacterium]
MLPTLALAATPAQDLEGLSSHLDVAMAKAQAGDLAGSQAEYQAFNQGWPGIEDGVRQQNRDQYRQIEARMTDVGAAYAIQPRDAVRVQTSLKALDDSVDAFISASSAPSAATSASPASAPVQQGAPLGGEVQILNEAQAKITANDAAGAAASVKDFIAGWPAVEGTVAAKDASSYTAIENEMAQAYGLLTSNPPNMPQASMVIKDMQARLAPFAAAPVRYGLFDAAIILLREGFEALLVFAALLAFLKRSGNGAKQAWIWAGGVSGLALSVVIAVIVNLAFARAGGSSRELLEGVTGLVAAAMLIWMMFWLHGKANVSAWSRYISERSERAIAANSL